MKKIISVILCMLCLSAVVFILFSCKPKEEDLYEMMYNNDYTLEEIKAYDITNMRRFLTEDKIPQQISDLIVEIKITIGDTVFITREEVFFESSSHHGNTTKFKFAYNMDTNIKMSFIPSDDFPLSNNLLFNSSRDSNGKIKYNNFDITANFETDDYSYEIFFKFVKNGEMLEPDETFYITPKELILGYTSDTLALGEKKYAFFEPDYSGTYIINLHKDINVKINEGNKNISFSRTNGQSYSILNINLKVGHEYFFDFSFFNKTQSGAFWLEIDLDEIKSEETKEISIEANDSFIITFDPESIEVYKIFVEISEIGIEILRDDFLSINSALTNCIYQSTLNIESLYILLINNSDFDVTTNLSIGFPEILNENEQYNKLIKTEYINYKFVASEDSWYSVTEEYDNGRYFSDYLPSADLNLSTASSINTWGCKITNIYLQAGQAFYLGFKAIENDINIDIQFAKAEDTYKWVVDSGSGEEEIEGNTIKVPRGESRIIKLKVNESYFQGRIQAIDGNYGHRYTYEDFVLKISKDASLSLYGSSNPIILAATQGSQLMPFYIWITYDTQPVFETYRNSGSDFGIKFSKLTDIEGEKVAISLYLVFKNGLSTKNSPLIITDIREASTINLSKYANYYDNTEEFEVVINKLTLYNSNGTSVKVYVNNPNMIHNISVDLLRIQP